NFNSEILNAGLEQTILASATGQQTASDSETLATNQLTFGSASVTIVNAPPVPATLSGRVYVDSNGDGTFDSGDSGLGNVVVALFDSSHNAVGSPQITAADGSYSFTNLAPGTYSVGEVKPTGFFETAVNVGTVNGASSGTSSGLDTINSIVLDSGSTGVDYNFGVQAPVGLSGTAYVDQNNDQTFDTGDTVLAGVSVQLLDSTNTPVGSPKVTDASGNFSFTGLAPGTYSLKETPPAGAFATAANVGSINGSPVGTASDSQTISTIALGSGQAGTGYDFALGQFGTISGTEFIDNDANNSFNTGDSPLPGVTVQLLNAASQVVDSKVTAADGTYAFTNVVPGTYTVHETDPGNGLVPTSSTIGNDSGTQVGVDTISSIVIGNGTVASGYNFGTQSNIPPIVQVRLAATALDGSALPSTIPGGSKFWLYEYVTDLRQPTSDALGVEEAYSTITFDSSKFQVVSPLTFAPNYQFSESPSNGQAPTNLANVGAFAGTTSFPSLNLGNQGSQEQLVFQVELEAVGGGSSDITVGLPTSTPLNPLGIAVFADPPALDSPLLTASQVHFIGLSNLQTTEPTFVSIDSPVTVTNSSTAGATTPLNFTVHLSQPSPVPITVTYTTQDIGSDNAVGGNTASTPGADYVLPDFDGTPANENVGEFTIPANTQDLTVPLVQAIGNSLNQADKSFHVVLTSADNNIVVSQSANSSQAVIQSAVPQPTITVQPTSGSEGDVATFSVTVSAGSGQTITVHYETTASSPQSAIPGTDFQVTSGDLTFLPSNTGSTQTVQIALPFDPSEVPPTTFQFVLSAATNATLSGGQSQLAVLGTILPPATGSLSGFVYHDINGNGLRDAGETGYAGVTVALTGTTIFGQQVSLTTTTAADGSYVFSHLVAGHYVIKETQPLIFLEGLDHIGTQGGDASVQDQFTIDLGNGVAGTNNNFGEGDVNPNMFWWPYF
ncbi:MAG TPA: SdrD B-like domain-containing protein, partial [Pirellulales bacterium]|nr:SdrD B-like domain-containing protein [Pirellulales bacterium]